VKSCIVGKVYQAIPWKELLKQLKLRESPKGPLRMFSPQGMIALMFLKSYACCSDKKLIEQLNGNINYQLFCGIFLGTNRIANYKIVSEIRCVLSKKN